MLSWGINKSMSQITVELLVHCAHICSGVGKGVVRQHVPICEAYSLRRDAEIQPEEAWTLCYGFNLLKEWVSLSKPRAVWSSARAPWNHFIRWCHNTFLTWCWTYVRCWRRAWFSAVSSFTLKSSVRVGLPEFLQVYSSSVRIQPLQNDSTGVTASALCVCAAVPKTKVCSARICFLKFAQWLSLVLLPLLLKVSDRIRLGFFHPTASFSCRKAELEPLEAITEFGILFCVMSLRLQSFFIFFFVWITGFL